MKFRFTEKMFEAFDKDRHLSDLIAEQANQSLDEYLKTTHRIYLNKDGQWKIGARLDDTHWALLFDREEINCKHEPKTSNYFSDGCNFIAFDPRPNGYISCSKCGKKLKPQGDWEVDE